MKDWTTRYGGMTMVFVIWFVAGIIAAFIITYAVRGNRRHNR